MVDLGDFERSGICNRGVTVSTRKINGIVRRNFVEISTCRKLRRLPESLNPPAAGDPFAALTLRDALLNFGEKIFERVRAFEIEVHLPLADSEDVAMRIGQSRHHGFAAKVDNARFLARELFRVRV